MDKFSVVILFVMVLCVVAEPPVPYALKSHSHGFNGPPPIQFGGHSSILSGIGGGYHGINSGYQSSEGLFIDPSLLHKIKQILLDQENLHSGIYDGHGAYSVPVPHYGVPHHYRPRVVGIELGHINQGLQVAQFHQVSHAPVFDLPYPSHQTVLLPPQPSGSYGIPGPILPPPLPSGSYGPPSHHH